MRFGGSRGRGLGFRSFELSGRRLIREDWWRRGGSGLGICGRGIRIDPVTRTKRGREEEASRNEEGQLFPSPSLSLSLPLGTTKTHLFSSRRERNHPRTLFHHPREQHLAHSLRVSHHHQSDHHPRERERSGGFGGDFRFGLFDEDFGEMVEDPDVDFWGSCLGGVEDEGDFGGLARESDERNERRGREE